MTEDSSTALNLSKLRKFAKEIFTLEQIMNTYSERSPRLKKNWDRHYYLDKSAESAGDCAGLYGQR
jgi:hypothetical protein